MDLREFSYTVFRSGEQVADGTVMARTAEDAVRRALEQQQGLASQGGTLNVAKPTGQERGDTASGTYADLQIRVQPSSTRTNATATETEATIEANPPRNADNDPTKS